MRTTAARLIGLLLCVSGLSCASLPGPRATVDRFLRGLESYDTQAVVATFSDDASVFFPIGDVPLRADGKEEIADVFGRFFARARASDAPNNPLVPEDVAVEERDGYALLTFQIEKPAVISRRTFVLRREGGQWRIVHLHASNVRLVRDAAEQQP